MHHSGLVLLSALACNSLFRSDDPDEPPDDTSDTADDTGTPDPNPDCPGSRGIVGMAGQVDRTSFEFAWAFDFASGLSASDPIIFEVPDDIVSLSFTVDEGSTPTGFAGIEVGSDVWLDLYGGPSWDEPPLYHLPFSPAGTVVLPNNADTWPSPGCAAIVPVADANLTGASGQLEVVAKRAEGEGVLDLALIVVGDTEVYVDELQASVDRMREIYDLGKGPVIGDVGLYSVAGNALPTLKGREVDALSATLTDANDGAVNILFISDFIDESGILGVAGGIPGPLALPGTAKSAVFIAVDPHLDYYTYAVDTQTMGETMAHEVGHQLGLFHTTEADGASHDPIADTPECPASQDRNGDGSLLPSECRGLGGANFMFWTSGNVAQTGMTDTQADVLYFSPTTR